MAIDDQDPVDQGHPSSIPNILLELIAEADDLALEELTPDEYERMADADKTIVRLGKAKRELVRTVLTKDGKSEDDWRGRLAPSGRDELARGDVGIGEQWSKMPSSAFCSAAPQHPSSSTGFAVKPAVIEFWSAFF